MMETSVAEVSQETQPIAEVQVGTWATIFFGQEDFMNDEIKTLFDDPLHGIKALYHPGSCIQQALKPSNFDMADYHPPKTKLIARQCTALFKGAKDKALRARRLNTCLYQLYQNMESIGMRSFYPKIKARQLELVDEILKQHAEDTIIQCLSQAFSKVHALNHIAAALWEKRLDTPRDMTYNSWEKKWPDKPKWEVDNNGIPLPAVYGDSSFIKLLLPTDMDQKERVFPNHFLPSTFKNYFANKEEKSVYRFRGLVFELKAALGTVGIAIQHPGRDDERKWQSLYDKCLHNRSTKEIEAIATAAIKQINKIARTMDEDTEVGSFSQRSSYASSRESIKSEVTSNAASQLLAETIAKLTRQHEEAMRIQALKSENLLEAILAKSIPKTRTGGGDGDRGDDDNEGNGKNRNQPKRDGQKPKRPKQQDKPPKANRKEATGYLSSDESEPHKGVSNDSSSDAGSESDDKEDEFAPASRKDFNKHEVIPQFEGDKKDKATSFRFLHKFLQHARYFQWRPVDWHSELRAHVDNRTWDWFSQLNRSQKSNLKEFSKAFRLRFMKSRYPKDEAYLHATQAPHEDLEDFIIRFNKLATKAGHDVFSSPKRWRIHYRKLLKALHDESLRTKLTILNPRTWSELDDNVIEIQNDEAHDDFLHHRKRQINKSEQQN